MKAAIMRGGKIVADEIEAPKPGAGEVLVKTLACGIYIFIFLCHFG